MRLTVVDHPLVAHKLALLRDESTQSPQFRLLTDELVTLLAYEATRGLPVAPVTINTPVAETTLPMLTDAAPLVVPILRAGLGMLDGMLKILPTAKVGFIGIMRDERTLQPITYTERLPDDLSGRHCFVLDPMLATGGSLVSTIKELLSRGAGAVTAICLLGAPEGVHLVDKALEDKDVTVILGALDERLDEHGYIVPGLGDAGDRLYGEAE